MLGRALIVWLALVLVAIGNGAVREFVVTPRWGAAVGHVASSLLLSLLILAVAWLAIPWIAPSGTRAALQVGLLWLACTVAFEFGFGRWRGKSWQVLLADYDLSRGRIWLLVLVATVLAPWVAWRLRHSPPT